MFHVEQYLHQMKTKTAAAPPPFFRPSLYDRRYVKNFEAIFLSGFKAVKEPIPVAWGMGACPHGSEAETAPGFLPGQPDVSPPRVEGAGGFVVSKRGLAPVARA